MWGFFSYLFLFWPPQLSGVPENGVVLGDRKHQGCCGSRVWTPAKESGPATPDLALRGAVLCLHTSSTRDRTHQLWCGPFSCPIRDWDTKGVPLSCYQSSAWHIPHPSLFPSLVPQVLLLVYCGFLPRSGPVHHQKFC